WVKKRKSVLVACGLFHLISNSLTRTLMEKSLFLKIFFGQDFMHPASFRGSFKSVPFSAIKNNMHHCNVH
ncbi:MAG: hypothetical protein OEL85_08655, partial [Desulfobulbaceae bacterium]|nr:hypothetical protein [Desulfobulbaceae bacterium]